MSSIPLDSTQDNPLPEITWIYGLECPLAGYIRYIGKSDNPEERLKAHLRDKKDTYKVRWLHTLTAQGLSPRLIYLEEVPYAEWKQCERWWIQFFRDHDYNLTNTAEGGTGGRTLSPEGYAQMGKDHKPSPALIEQRAAKLRGRPQHPDSVTKRMDSRRKNAKPYPEEGKEKLKAINTGKQHTPQARAKIQAIADTRKGVKRPPGVGAKVSAARKGKKRKPFSEEWKHKLGNSRRGQSLPPERIAHLNSPESVAKRAATNKLRHAMKKQSPHTSTLWD